MRLATLTENGRGKISRCIIATVGIVALAFSLVCLAGCSSGESSSNDSKGGSGDLANLDPVTFIGGDSTAKGAAGQLWAEDFAKRCGELSDGKITIQWHPNGELGGDADQIRQVQSNDIQFYVTQPATEVPFVPELAVFDSPMAFADYDSDQIESVLNGDNEFTQQLQVAFENAGFHNIAWLQDGTYRETSSNKNLATLEDFKGFQIRTMENNNHMALWKALGAEPTPLAFAEVYFALQNGTVDGQENATDTTAGNGFHEVQDYLCMTHHILYANNLFVNKETWESLDPAYQEIIQKAAAQATENIRGQLGDINEQNIKTMTDAGITVVEYDADFYEQIRNLDGIKALNEEISKQTNGLSETMLKELEATKK
ncbi:MAG: TRAP transporter substrate-binding protein [Eggerthellaceae bacterium]